MPRRARAAIAETGADRATQPVAEWEARLAALSAELRSSEERHSLIVQAVAEGIYEWDIEHIPGALHIPQGRVKAEVEQALPDKGAPIVVYCRSGRRSAFAAQTLEALGYSDVRNLEGGIVAWMEQGRPLWRSCRMPPGRRVRSWRPSWTVLRSFRCCRSSPGAGIFSLPSVGAVQAEAARRIECT